MNDNNKEIKPVSEEKVRYTADRVIKAAKEAIRAEIDLWPEAADELGTVLTSGIAEQFEQFNYGKPEELDGMANSVTLAIAELNSPELHNPTVVNQAVAEWQGNAADKFHELLIAPFPYINANQLLAMGALHNSIMASRGIMYSGRQGVVTLGEQAIARLKQIKEEAESSDVLGDVLTIVGVVASIAAAAIPVVGPAVAVLSRAGTAVAATGTSAKVASLAFTMAGQAAGVAKSEMAPPSVQGETTAQVLASLTAQIAQLWGTVQDETGILEEAVNADIGTLDPAGLLPQSPDAAVLGAKDPHTFRPPPADD